jgi:hypothetical protein
MAALEDLLTFTLGETPRFARRTLRVVLETLAERYGKPVHRSAHLQAAATS